jgi:hypothetical protein
VRKCKGVAPGSIELAEDDVGGRDVRGDRAARHDSYSYGVGERAVAGDRGSVADRFAAEGGSIDREQRRRKRPSGSLRRRVAVLIEHAHSRREAVPDIESGVGRLCHQ